MLFVIKFGSTSITKEVSGKPQFNEERVQRWAQHIAELFTKGHRFVIVSSGAILSGSQHIALPGEQLSTIEKQALAAIGQPYLMDNYRRCFSAVQIPVAQVLLTDDDMSSVERSLNIQNTLNTLLGLNVIPIINENDTTSFSEIQFGDNDKLSALVAAMIKADRLIVASDVNGLYPEDPTKVKNQNPILEVKQIDDNLLKLAAPPSSWKSRGGMYSKLLAMKLANESGVDGYITHADNSQILSLILQAKHVGTHFCARGKMIANTDTDEIPQDLLVQLQQLKAAASELLDLDMPQKNKVLLGLSKALKSKETQKNLIAVNTKEVAAHQATLSKAFLDRMTLTPERILAMAKQIESVVKLPDPLSKKLSKKIRRTDGLLIEKQRVPLGAVAMIFESRPNVLIEAFSLCFKAGNSVFLRCGSETFQTCKSLLALVHTVLDQAKISRAVILMPASADRKYVLPLLRAKKYLDLVIPRGGESLIRFVDENSRIPVVKHDKGVCHLFVDEDADLKMAVKILVNGKVQRPGVCNSLETLLVHGAVVEKFMKMALPELDKNRVECRLEESLFDALKADYGFIKKASDQDWDTEYLDLIIAIKQVASVDEAIDFIAKHSSNHSDAICTKNPQSAEKFLNKVDSAAVYHNASTRFTDGFELGLGAEMGISTQKLHVRGPMGLEALTTEKYVIRGKGHVRKG